MRKYGIKELIEGMKNRKINGYKEVSMCFLDHRYKRDLKLYKYGNIIFIFIIDYFWKFSVVIDFDTNTMLWLKDSPFSETQELCKDLKSIYKLKSTGVCSKDPIAICKIMKCQNLITCITEKSETHQIQFVKEQCVINAIRRR